MILIAAWLLLGSLAAAAYLWYVMQHPKTAKRLLAVGLIIAALIYIGLAIFEGDSRWVGVEAAGTLLYSAFALAGLKYTVRWIAIGWLLHPLWDLVVHYAGPGAHIVPAWYAWACLSFDVIVALYIGKRNWE